MSYDTRYRWRVVRVDDTSAPVRCRQDPIFTIDLCLISPHLAHARHTTCTRSGRGASACGVWRPRAPG
eukprot:scaffold5667_cov68-Phaeocystis_antarctica.AAC.2